MAEQPDTHGAGETADHRPLRRAVGVDGKTLCGSGAPGGKVHLLAAMDHTSHAVLAQVRVDGKSNEITAFQPLLDQVDLEGAVVTADAMHTQREHVDYLVNAKRAGYICIDRGHGRYEVRRLQVVSSSRLDLPHAAQAIRLTRRVRQQKTNKWRTVTVYAVTNLTAVQAGPAELAQHIRNHWGIEALHHIRDVTCTEDASQVRTGNAPGLWPASAISPSASCITPDGPTSPKPYATTSATPCGR